MREFFAAWLDLNESLARGNAPRRPTDQEHAAGRRVAAWIEQQAGD
jgi:hypothetical protein